MKLLIAALLTLALCSTSYAKHIKTDITKDATTWENKYGDKYVFIYGLEKTLFQKFHEKQSSGPKWKDQAEEIIEDSFDVHEYSSYWGERYNDQCVNFSQDDLEDSDSEIEFKWIAVKNLRGSQKSVMYIAKLYTILHAYGKFCEIAEEKEFVFLNRVKNGSPVYLGVRQDSVPKF